MAGEEFEVTHQQNGPDHQYVTVEQFQSIERRLLHTDRELGEVRAEVSGMSATLRQVFAQNTEQKDAIQRLADTVNTPKTFNVWAALSAVIGLVLACAGYVELNLSPIRDNIDGVADTARQNSAGVSVLQAKATESISRSKSLGELILRAEQLLHKIETRVDRADARVTAHDERLNAHARSIEIQREFMVGLSRDLSDARERAAAAEVSRDAIHEYLRDVDRFGSRKWIPEEIPPQDTSR